MTGSAALAICYVAAGRFDAWLEAFIGKWDFSAAALMVLELVEESLTFAVVTPFWTDIISLPLTDCCIRCS